MDNLPVNDDRPHILSFGEIKQAAERIEGGIIHTPLCEAKLSKYMDYNIYLKCENLQYTGSCAERGVRNALLAHGVEGTERGVIVPSNTNMALGTAYQGSTLGVPVTVVLPELTPSVHTQRCSELGADVVLFGDTLDDAVSYARKVHRDSRQTIIESDDPLVMAGLGTVGVEIITQLPEADAVIVPVGAGGLLASVLVACKKLKYSANSIAIHTGCKSLWLVMQHGASDCLRDVLHVLHYNLVIERHHGQLIGYCDWRCVLLSAVKEGAECAKVPKMMKALQAGRPVSVAVVPNLADGLNVSTVGTNAFASLKGRLDRMLVVDELYIARALISMLERERLVADGAGVCAIAAVMQGLVPELRGKRAVCIVSGGNIDSSRLSRTIQRGLGASGRLMRFAVAVPDHRTGLEQLAKTISNENAVLKSLVTEQMWLHSDVGTTWANVVVETASADHASNFKDRLRDLYPSARFAVIDLEDKHKVFVR